MIKLIPDPTFDALVKLTVPGLSDPVEVSMVFRHKNLAEIPQWFKDNENKPSADALDEIIVSWTGVMGEDGQAVPYSKEALATLLKSYAPSAREILRAWQLELNESRVKN